MFLKWDRKRCQVCFKQNVVLIKYPLQFVLTFLLFICINTSFYWEGDLGILAFPAFFILFIVYFILSIELIRQVYISFRDKFVDKPRNVLLSCMFFCLILIITKPNGIIDFDKLEGEDRIIAHAEGVANCTSRLKLKDSGQFTFESICFGIERSKGEYKIIKDTVYFTRTTRNKFHPKFATINKEKNEIIIYNNKNDKNPMHLSIVNK